MSASDAAAWWQAIIGGVAIVASGAIAVFVPWNERRHQRRREDRARLDIDARTSKDGGLELLIIYRPEFHHHALSATVNLLSPTDARLYRGKTIWPNDAKRPTATKGSLATNVRYHAVPLIEWEGSRVDNQFAGFMFIEYPDERRGPGKAKLQISIMLHGNLMIARHEVTVSAMDVEFFPNGGPSVIIDMRAKHHKSL